MAKFTVFDLPWIEHLIWLIQHGRNDLKSTNKSFSRARDALYAPFVRWTDR